MASWLFRLFCQRIVSIDISNLSEIVLTVSPSWTIYSSTWSLTLSDTKVEVSFASVVAERTVDEEGISQGSTLLPGNS